MVYSALPVPRSLIGKFPARLAFYSCLTTGFGFSENQPPRSISSSRQFLVYGGELALRGAICELAERTKSNLLHLLGLADNWKTPLIVRLEYPQANFPDAPPAQLEVSQLGYRLKLQLNLLMTREVERRAVQRELLRTILIELVYRDRVDVAAGTPYVGPPDWLLDGTLGLQSDTDRDENAELLQGFVAENKIPALEEIVREDRSRLDPGSRKLYDACSEALLQLLLEIPDGRQKLVRYLKDLPDAPNDLLADLIVHFPERLGRSSRKWWTLTVARLAASNRYQVLSAIETAAFLDRALRFAIPGADRAIACYSLGDFRQFQKLPAAREVLEQVSRQLLLLGTRAHPYYRWIVQENYQIVQRLARGKTHHVAERLEEVARERERVECRRRTIDDYLNWYEATQAKAMSGAFSELLRLSGRDQNKEPRRRDPISVYLDFVELEML